MPCQIGIYERPDDSVDEWTSLISVDDRRSPRELLRGVVPFLKRCRALPGGTDASTLGAWLTWHLVESARQASPALPRIRVARRIDGRAGTFISVSPTLVQVFRIDELLEWRRIAAIEITGRRLARSTEPLASGPGATQP